MTIHDWDMARFLIGNKIDEVFVRGGVLVDPAIGEAGDIDTHVALLRFAHDVIGTVDNSRKAVYGYDQRVEVFGSQGAIHTDNNYPNSSVLSTTNAIARELPLNFFMQRYVEEFALGGRSVRGGSHRRQAGAGQRARWPYGAGCRGRSEKEFHGTASCQGLGDRISPDE